MRRSLAGECAGAEPPNARQRRESAAVDKRGCAADNPKFSPNVTVPI
jgi:hypothetical protein